jgi:hypothetical protein
VAMNDDCKVISSLSDEYNCVEIPTDVPMHPGRFVLKKYPLRPA